MAEVRRNLYDGILLHEVGLAQTMAARSLVEQEPNYAYVSARLLLNNLRTRRWVLSCRRWTSLRSGVASFRYEEYFPEFVRSAIELEFLDKELGNFDLARLAAALKPERDRNFQFLGLQTLYDRYFLHKDGVRFELPQAFFMRVAMGLAVREIDRDARAIEFYDLLSSFDFMCSTPTLFNSGTLRPQLSSCFLTTISDDLDGIFKAIKDNALLSKYAGGLGNDWSGVRGLGAHIRGTNGQSQGVVPFLKVANDTAIAVNQGGKRKGAVCGYLETWHIDIEEFLDLRKNTGDDRRRTHDMNTANWVPDLFMERVEADGNWTLFSPDEVPDLHDLYGAAFAERYAFYEAKAQRGEMQVTPHRARAGSLAQDADDALRDRASVDHVQGSVQSAFAAAARRRGALLESLHRDHAEHQQPRDRRLQPGFGQPREPRYRGRASTRTASTRRRSQTAMRMLDNVIDINFYTVPEARHSNLRHRPVGLGIMGYQDALYTLRFPIASESRGSISPTRAWR